MERLPRESLQKTMQGIRISSRTVEVVKTFVVVMRSRRVPPETTVGGTEDEDNDNVVERLPTSVQPFSRRELDGRAARSFH